MVIQLAILAILSAVGGFMGLPHLSWLAHWLDPVIPHEHSIRQGISETMEWVLMGVSTIGAIFGIFVAMQIYSNLPKADALKKKWSGVHSGMEHKWYVDELYEAVIIRPIRMLSDFLWKVFDVRVIDRIVLTFGRLSEQAGSGARLLQTGSIQVYALTLFIGLVLTLGYLIYGMV